MKIHDVAPDSKLLPYMLSDTESEDLRISEEDAAARLQDRIADIKNRDEGRAGTRYIIGAAAVMAAFALLGVKAINYNQAHPVDHNTPEQTGSSSNR